VPVIIETPFKYKTTEVPDRVTAKWFQEFKFIVVTLVEANAHADPEVLIFNTTVRLVFSCTWTAAYPVVFSSTPKISPTTGIDVIYAQHSTVKFPLISKRVDVVVTLTSSPLPSKYPLPNVDTPEYVIPVVGTVNGWRVL
jgi:hypothetical protein